MQRQEVREGDSDDLLVEQSAIIEEHVERS